MSIHIIYVISDSLGETAELVARAAASQFDGGDFLIRRFSYVSDSKYVEEIVEKAEEEKALLIFTVVLPSIKNKILEMAQAKNMKAVDVLGPLMETLAEVTGKDPRLQPGLIRRLDENYFRKMEAIEFAVKCDDGKNPRGLLYADLVLIGVSRTSKTPVSLYLAHKNLKVANLPLVPETPLPEELFLIPTWKIIGFTIDADKLYSIRLERLKTLGLPDQAGYADRNRIEEELAYACKVMDQLGCPVIDVTHKAVEETAALILQIYNRREKHGR